MSINVLLSTYNGEKYLSELLDSLLSQTYSDFQILVRDDGSTDETQAIIEHYKKCFKDRLFIINEPLGRVGPVGSFSALMCASTSDYVLFADQDDVWVPEKVETLYEEMLRCEAFYPGVPILVQSDLEVVDENLNILSHSFWEFEGLDPSRNELRNLIMQNTVTGCAVMANKNLIKKACPVPESAIMHDWWMAIIASSFGYVSQVYKPLVKYRQHGKNSVGAESGSFLCFIKKRIEILFSEKMNLFKIKTLKENQRQMQSFLNKYDSLLSFQEKKMLNDFVTLYSMSYIGRRYFLIKNGMMKQGFLRNILLFLTV